MARQRTVHPLAWWLWAIALALSALRTTNVLLLCVIAAVAGFVVTARRTPAAWGGAFKLMAWFALTSVVMTMLLAILLGVRTPGHVLLDLPQWHLPSWSAGLTVLGPITAESLLNTLAIGLRLAVLVLCFGAANSLAHPGRLLSLVPAALYELGVAVVVALTFIPQLTESVSRVRKAQRLRGRSLSGIRGLRGLAVPVLEEALERAIALAASMDSRGYGRTATVSSGVRILTRWILLSGLGAVLIGTYFVVDPTASHAFGIAAVVGGTAAAVGAGFLAGRQVRRTKYRDDPWGAPEWLVVSCGAITFIGFVFGNPGNADVVDLAWPALPVIPFIAALVSAIPAVATPSPHRQESAPVGSVVTA